MGAGKSTPVDPPLADPPDPSCVVCFEQSDRAITCERGHSLCSACIRPYVSSLTEDVGKLKDRKYVIRCPEIKCSSAPYRTSDLFKYCEDAATMNKYIGTLVEICQHSSTGVYHAEAAKPITTQNLLEALNFKCPNPACRTVLDPTPDGCCAVRCSACATYTCFLCFTACDSSSSCHEHVRKCPFSPKPGNLFISEEARAPAHKRARVMQLREVLGRELIPGYTSPVGSTSSSEKWQASNRIGGQLSTLPVVKKHLGTILISLKGVDITIDDVLKLDVQPQTSSVAQQTVRTARVLAAGRGPLLQPAVGRYIEAWEVCTLLCLAGLVLSGAIYVVFLLASLANMRKAEAGAGAHTAAVEDIENLEDLSPGEGWNRADAIAMGLPDEGAEFDSYGWVSLGSSMLYGTVVMFLVIFCLFPRACVQ